MDCGPTCLKMILNYYGKSFAIDYLRTKACYNKEGVSMLSLADAAESLGLKAIGVKLTFEELIKDAPLPCILHWDQFHFVVLTPNSNKKRLVIADPAIGLIKITKKIFKIAGCPPLKMVKRKEQFS